MSATAHTITASDGTPIHVETWRPAGPPTHVVVICHGGGEHVSRYAQLAGELAEQGAVVFGPDHRGHGRSGGPKGHATSFEEYAHDLLAVMKDHIARGDASEGPLAMPWFLFGHSMGGLISLVYLLEHGKDLPLRGAIISSPLLGLTMKVNPLKLALGKIAAKLAPRLALPSGIPADRISRDADVVQRYVDDPLRVPVVTAGWFAGMNAAIARVNAEAKTITLPSLWYVGTADGVVDPVETQRVFAALPDAAKRDQTLRTFDGYYHELHNEPPELRAPIVAMIRGWIADHS